MGFFCGLADGCRLLLEGVNFPFQVETIFGNDPLKHLDSFLEHLNFRQRIFQLVRTFGLLLFISYPRLDYSRHHHDSDQQKYKNQTTVHVRFPYKVG